MGGVSATTVSVLPMRMQVVEGLVSVIIPLHDRRRFVGEAIESVLAQTYPDWELLIVDDGSSDGSADIARGYSSWTPDKIRYVEHPGHVNFGVTRTRNVGAAASRGEFLAFLDSDDKWMPHKLADQIQLLQAHPEVGLVCAPSVYWRDWDHEAPETAHRENSFPEIAPSGQVYESPYLLIHTYPLGDWGAPCPSSLLMRRSAFEAVDGFVEEFNPTTFQLCEDTAFLSKIYLSSVRVMVSQSISDYYRRHDSSIWDRTMGNRREELELKFYFQWLRRFLVERECRDKTVWKAARRAGWIYWWPLPHQVTRLIRRLMNKWRTVSR